MKSERAALNLLRNVYKKKGTTDYDLAGYRLVEDRYYIVFMCKRCGAFLDALYLTCPVCGRIFYLHLKNNRVIDRDIEGRRKSDRAEISSTAS